MCNYVQNFLLSAVNGEVFGNKFHILSDGRHNSPAAVKVLAIVMPKLIARMRNDLAAVLGKGCI